MAEKKGKKAEKEGKAEGKKPKEGKAGGKKPQEKKGKAPAEKARKEQQIMRLAETNLDGNLTVGLAIRRIKGVGTMLSNAIIKKSGFGGRKLGELSDQELKALEGMISDPAKHGVPSWMFNRRKDPQTARDKHLSVSGLEWQKKLDINELKKIKCYRGVRHSLGLPVRGQRTRGAFRKSGKVVGVSRKKAQQAAAGGKK